MATNRIDLRTFKTGAWLRLVIWHFGLRNHFGKSLTKRGPCPFCCTNRPGKKCFAVDLEKGGWYCHSCLRNGDSLTLYSGLAGVGVWEAAKDLSNLNGTPVPWLGEIATRRCVESNPIVSKAPEQANENNSLAGGCDTVKPTAEEILGSGFPPPLSLN